LNRQFGTYGPACKTILDATEKDFSKSGGNWGILIQELTLMDSVIARLVGRAFSGRV
jgi:hypothetical protein